MDQTYAALRRRIVSLSFDPYLLTNATLSRITEIEQMLTNAAPDQTEAVFLALCTECRERLARENTAARTKEARKKNGLLNTYNNLLESISRFLSTELIRETATVWFSRPNEDKLRELEDGMRSLLSECEAAESELLLLCDLHGSEYAADACQNEILTLKIAATLCAQSLPNTYGERLDELSASARKLEAREESDKRLRSIGIQISVELLPPFLESLYPFLKDDAAMRLEASDVRRIVHEVQAFREKLRQAAEPLLKSRSGGKKI